jgi:uncharacterized protein (DUF1800 family)
MTAMKRRTFLQAAGYTTLYGGLVSDFSKHAAALTPRQIATDDQDLHLLRRISFGPVAQELAQVRSLGRAAYIEQQLTATDSATEAAATALYPLIAADALTLYSSSGAGFHIDQHLMELQSAMIYRALFSKAQLHEVMTDFWNDHFNTYLKKNPIPLKITFDRDVIRANALGNFKTLLRATVRHGEMLFYLDNWMNQIDAINENYARELLELHTLGKDGGYSEADMKALSFILSGLTYRNTPFADLLSPTGFGQAWFRPELHDAREKTFLGQHFPAGGGEEEIDRALDLILDHPGTARFIAGKLCRRFVSDTPPEALVQSVAASFTASGGDIPAMLRTLLLSPEFAASSGEKFKRPLPAMLGAARACGINQYDYTLNTELYGTAMLGNGLLYRSLTAAGQQPFGWVPPNGYPDHNSYWANTNSLLYQQKFLVRLSETLSYRRLLADPLAFLQQGSSTAAAVAQSMTPREAARNVIANTLFVELPAELTAAAVAFVAQDDDPDAALAANEIEPRIKGLVFALLSSPWFLAQ